MTNLINIVQNTKHYINVNVTTGTPPYTFKIFEANGLDITDPTKFVQIETTYVGSPTETSHQFTHLFNESVGNYTIKGEIADSCSLGPKIGLGIEDVTIYSPILTTISISPTSVSINVGSSQQLTTTCKDQNNNSITCPSLIWMSDDTSVATIDSTGKVTGVSVGTANMTANSGTISSNVSAITVTRPPTLTTITISPTTLTINVGTTGQLSVICKDQNGSTIKCPTLIWRSNNTAIATVNSTGLVTAISTGTTNITASYSGVTSSISTITVSSPVANILLNPGFETVDPQDSTKPQYWNKYKVLWVTTYNPIPWIYEGPGSGRDSIGRCVSINFVNLEKGNSASWLQCVKVAPGTTYTISGYMKTKTTGTGAQIKIDWFSDPCGPNWNYTSSTIIYNQNNTSNVWTFFSKKITVPANINGANITLVLLKGAKGKVSFDDMSITKS